MPGPASSPFRPNTAGTVTHAVTTTSSTPTALVGSGSDLLVQNVGATECFYEQGTSAVTVSTSTGLPIPAGAILVIGRDKNTTHIVSITAASTTTLRVTTGEGS